MAGREEIVTFAFPDIPTWEGTRTNAMGFFNFRYQFLCVLNLVVFLDMDWKSMQETMFLNGHKKKIVTAKLFC